MPTARACLSNTAGYSLGGQRFPSRDISSRRSRRHLDSIWTPSDVFRRHRRFGRSVWLCHRTHAFIATSPPAVLLFLVLRRRSGACALGWHVISRSLFLLEGRPG